MAALVKITRRRVVNIDGKKGQLQNVLRLRRNQHIFVKQGILDGETYYFYVAKVKNGSIVYFISNDYIYPYEVIELYKIRWEIELFHRTGKQSFGFSDCQMRSIEKQRQHALNVMHAYAYASINTALMGLSCVEDFVKHHRGAKYTFNERLKQRARRDSYEFA